MIGRLLTPDRPDFDSRPIDVGFVVDNVEPGHVFLPTLPSFTLSIIPPLLDILSRNYGWLYTISETVFKCHTLKVIWKSRLIGSVSKIQDYYIANMWCRKEPQDFKGLLCFNSRSRWLRGLAWVCGRLLTEIAGSNSAGNMDVCLVWVSSVFR